MIKSRRQMFIIIGAFILVMLLGTVTYAFFNYTRTGSANTIRTGRIAFNSTQGQAINLTNMFPIDVSNGIPNDATKVGSVTINVTGDTTYTDGIEYLVSAVNVQNTIGSGANAKALPISIDVSVASNTNNDPITTLGTSDDSYFTNRGSSVATSIYKVLANDVIENNEQLLVGYIKSGATGVDGNIVIRAYLDASKIAITDTYPEEQTDTNNDGYLDGTTSTWVGDRVVFTTNEWNSLQTNGVSFQVKVESNEGTWVEAPLAPGAIESCPGCKFLYINIDVNPELEMWTTWNTFGETPTVLTTGLYDSYLDVVSISGKPFFLGVKQNNQNQITNAYVCGIYNGSKPFCIEGTPDGSNYSNNSSFINGPDLWNNTCPEYVDDSDETVTNCDSNSLDTLDAAAYDTGRVLTGFAIHGGDYCYVGDNGAVGCRDY